MTIDLHAARPRTGEPTPHDAPRAAKDSDDGEYPFRWYLNAPEPLEETDEELVGTLFDGWRHLKTAQTLLDAASPKDGERLRAALSAGETASGHRWSGDALRAIVDLLSLIPDAIQLGGAIPRLDDDAVERLSARLPLTEFYLPAPVALEDRREAIRFWIHNAGIAGRFFAKALAHGASVAL